MQVLSRYSVKPVALWREAAGEEPARQAGPGEYRHLLASYHARAARPRPAIETQSGQGASTCSTRLKCGLLAGTSSCAGRRKRWLPRCAHATSLSRRRRESCQRAGGRSAPPRSDRPARWVVPVQQIEIDRIKTELAQRLVQVGGDVSRRHPLPLRAVVRAFADNDDLVAQSPLAHPTADDRLIALTVVAGGVERRGPAS